jgi:hypothetical protein
VSLIPAALTSLTVIRLRRVGDGTIGFFVLTQHDQSGQRTKHPPATPGGARSGIACASRGLWMDEAWGCCMVSGSEFKTGLKPLPGRWFTHPADGELHTPDPFSMD